MACFEEEGGEVGLGEGSLRMHRKREKGSVSQVASNGKGARKRKGTRTYWRPSIG